MGLVPEFPGKDVGIGAVPGGDIAQPVPVIPPCLFVRPEIVGLFARSAVCRVEGICVPQAFVKVAARGELAIGAQAQHDLDPLPGGGIEDVIEFPCIGKVVPAESSETRRIPCRLSVSGPFNSLGPGYHPDAYPVAAGLSQGGEPVVVVPGAPAPGPAHVLSHREEGAAVVPGEKTRAVLVRPDEAGMGGRGGGEGEGRRRGLFRPMLRVYPALPLPRALRRKTYSPSRLFHGDKTFTVVFNPPLKGLHVETIDLQFRAGFMGEDGMDIDFVRVERRAIGAGNAWCEFQKTVAGDLGGIGLDGCYRQGFQGCGEYRLSQV